MKTIKIIIFMLFLIFVGCSNNDNKNRIEASGNIEATNIIVSSKVSGEVLAIDKEEGEKVNKGDTIIIVDNELLTLQLDQAIANQKMAEAQLSLLKNGARREDIKQAEEALNQADVNYSTAKKDLDRMESLIKEGTITQKQYDDAAAKVQVTQAQLNGAKENYTKVKNLARPEEIKQSDANLARQVAAVKILEKNIRDSFVQSPVDGFIVKTFIEKGETVTQLSSLFKVADLSKVELLIYVSEEDLGKVKLGQKAEIKVDTYKDKSYEGKVIYISPEAEFTPKNIQTKDERTKLVFAVKIEINNPAFELKPGMPADASVLLN